MHHRMQRFHATVHHLRELRHLVNGGHGNAGLGDDFRRAARRNDFGAEFIVQSAREFHHARFVGHRDQNAFNLGISQLRSNLSIVNPFSNTLPSKPSACDGAHASGRNNCISAQGSSRASREPLRSNSACSAHRRARPQWQWRARPASWPRTSNQWGV